MTGHVLLMSQDSRRTGWYEGVRTGGVDWGVNETGTRRLSDEVSLPSFTTGGYDTPPVSPVRPDGPTHSLPHPYHRPTPTVRHIPPGRPGGPGTPS